MDNCYRRHHIPSPKRDKYNVSRPRSAGLGTEANRLEIKGIVLEIVGGRLSRERVENMRSEFAMKWNWLWDCLQNKKLIADKGKYTASRKQQLTITLALYSKGNKPIDEILDECIAFQKHSARRNVRNEIKAGRLPPDHSLPCHVCNKTAEEYHHYLGYAKEFWLYVIPICRTCHLKIHDSYMYAFPPRPDE